MTSELNVHSWPLVSSHLRSCRCSYYCRNMATSKLESLFEEAELCMETMLFLSFLQMLKLGVPDSYYTGKNALIDPL